MSSRPMAAPRLSAPPVGRLVPHAILLAYTALAVAPVLLIVVNSFKARSAIFGDPLAPPVADTFSLIGYERVLARSNFPIYYLNSTIVTIAALVLIVVLGSMAAFALSEYRFRGSNLLFLYLVVGIMIPIRLGTVSLLQLMVSLRLINTLPALILVYTAMGLPVAIFILRQMMEQVPRELKDAARIDGASEYRVYWLVVPLLRPAIGAVAIFTMLPVWNDLWFPLILAPDESTKTVTLGAQQFLGQFVKDWNAVLAALTLSMVPLVALYLLFSRQVLGGVTAGSIK
jgi:raffinose/stachyose/melibiose transport system permease protein